MLQSGVPNTIEASPQLEFGVPVSKLGSPKIGIGSKQPPVVESTLVAIVVSAVSPVDVSGFTVVVIDVDIVVAFVSPVLLVPSVSVSVSPPVALLSPPQAAIDAAPHNTFKNSRTLDRIIGVEPFSGTSGKPLPLPTGRMPAPPFVRD
jgi:hypothetical protein